MGIFSIKSNVIAYTVNKVRGNNMQISIQNGEVLVRAPWYMSYNKIQDIVQEKRNWIIRNLNNYKTYIKESEYKIVKIFGQEYKLNVNYKNIKIPELNLEEKQIEVFLPLKYKRIQKTQIVNLLIDKMYEQIANKEIEAIMEKTRIMLKIAPENYRICKMNNEIARCDNKNEILIDPKIVAYKKEVVEYIIAHEFCHLKYKVHSKGFYDMLNNNFANHKDLQNYIKRMDIKI